LAVAGFLRFFVVVGIRSIPRLTAESVEAAEVKEW
jgi:hypothetical protein